MLNAKPAKRSWPVNGPKVGLACPTMQFIRFAPWVRQRGGIVVVEVQLTLLPLLKRCEGIDRLLPRGAALPDFDVQAPLLSLSSLFHTTVDTIPASAPYLRPDPRQEERWAAEMQGLRT